MHSEGSSLVVARRRRPIWRPATAPHHPCDHATTPPSAKYGQDPEALMIYSPSATRHYGRVVHRETHRRRMPAAGPRMLPPSPSALPGCRSRSLRAASGRRDGFAVGTHARLSSVLGVRRAWLKKAGLEAWAWGSARRQCGSTGAPAACGSAPGTSGTPPHLCSRRTLQQHAEQSQARW